MRQSVSIIAAIAVLMVGQAARSEHASLPDGVTPVMATWLWGYHTIPASITKDGSPYWYAYAHTDASRINNPPWTEAAAKHIKAGAKAPAVLFLHGCSGLIRGGVGYRNLLMSEGYTVFEPDAYARPGHSCDTSSVAKRSEEVAYALSEIHRLPWVDQDRVVLMGFSEGGSTVAFWDQPGFMAHVILGAPARSRAPANVPVLAIAGAKDTYADANTYRQKKTVTPEPHGINGTWATTWGAVTFLVNSSGGIRGEYSHADGRIVGSLQENTLHGYWIQANSKRECARPREGSHHWGRVRVKFDDRLSAFSGGSSYCDEPVGPTDDWNGFRSASRADLKAILIAGAGHDTLGHPELKEAIKNFLRECCQ